MLEVGRVVVRPMPQLALGANVARDSPDSVVPPVQLIDRLEDFQRPASSVTRRVPRAGPC